MKIYQNLSKQLFLVFVIFIVATSVQIIRHQYFSQPQTAQNQNLNTSSSPADTTTPNPTNTGTPSPSLPLYTIGQVTRHASNFVNQNVKVSGYLIKRETGYLIFSDESGGAISSYDLPVTGSGIETVQPKQKYILEGKFVKGGLRSSNHNLYHLELLDNMGVQPVP